MIVGSHSVEHHSKIAWDQHEVYGEALSIIGGGCVRHFRNACEIAGVDPAMAASLEEQIDHRTMQAAHDYLAAVWRFKVRPTEPLLPIEEPEPPVASYHWLTWLRNDVRTWNEKPEIVRAVLEVRRNQNSERGYAAEDELMRLLRIEYRSISSDVD